LLELKEEIERLVWTASEENKTKEREINSLKDDLERLGIARDQALETQHNELTTSFENILKQREELYSNRENEIMKQLSSWQTKFENSRIENNRIRSDLNELTRRYENAIEDMNKKDESIRELKWQIDDEKMKAQQTEENYQRRIQALNLEINSLNDNILRNQQEMKRIQDKVSLASSLACSFVMA
jgi:chromosome segregation ATPase